MLTHDRHRHTSDSHAGPTDSGRHGTVAAGTSAETRSAESDCDRTASLRPFKTQAEADAAVAAIRERGRLIVGLDIGSNLFSFRDPLTGNITGFDVDIAGEVARDIFGKPTNVEYRILSSADRIAALQNNTVDIVAKTMTITCQRRKLINISTVYFTAFQRIMAARDSSIVRPSDLSGKRVCVARGTTSLQRVQESTPTGDLHGGELGGLPGGAAAVGGRCRQHRRLDPGRTNGPGPLPAHRRARYGRAAIRHRYQSEEHRTRTVRQRHSRTDPHRRDLGHPVPQVVNGTRPGAGPPVPRYLD